MSLPIRVCGPRYAVSGSDVQRDFDSVLTQFFGQTPWENPARTGSFIVDVREDENHLYVEADLPGYNKEQIDVTLENHTLTISARKDEKTNEVKKGEWHIRERRQQSVQRSFTLPNHISDQKVDAKLADGVLKVVLDKREETKPRKIPVA